MHFRPLGIAKDIIQAAGLRVSYTYNDLVFTEDNSVIFQFDDKNKKTLGFFINVTCDSSASDRIGKQLHDAAAEREYTIIQSGEFEMEKKKGSEETEIRLLPF